MSQPSSPLTSNPPRGTPLAPLPLTAPAALCSFWFYCAAIVGIGDASELPTWVDDYDHGSGVAAEPHVQYVYSMYWALTTLTTVG